MSLTLNYVEFENNAVTGGVKPEKQDRCQTTCNLQVREMPSIVLISTTDLLQIQHNTKDFIETSLRFIPVKKIRDISLEEWQTFRIQILF